MVIGYSTDRQGDLEHEGNRSSLVGEPSLVFDIGGTFLRAGLYDSTLHRTTSVVTLETSPPALDGSDPMAGIIALIGEAGRQLLKATAPRLVCVGFPGPVDAEGNAYAAPTVWGGQYSSALPVKTLIAGIWPGARIEVVNDVTAAGHFFVSEGCQDFCIVTVGSGIGNKIFINGTPILGRSARGGEIGHLRVDFSSEAATCDCGGVGHLGAIASGRGVRRQAILSAEKDGTEFGNSRIHAACQGVYQDLTNHMLVEAFLKGDSWTRKIVTQCTSYLGQALAGIHLNLGIEKFILVGGFASALGSEYLQIVVETAAACTWQNGFDWRGNVHLRSFEDRAGLNGAGRLLEKLTADPAYLEPLS